MNCFYKIFFRTLILLVALSTLMMLLSCFASSSAKKKKKIIITLMHGDVQLTSKEFYEGTRMTDFLRQFSITEEEIKKYVDQVKSASAIGSTFETNVIYSSPPNEDGVGEVVTAPIEEDKKLYLGFGWKTKVKIGKQLLHIVTPNGKSLKKAFLVQAQSGKDDNEKIKEFFDGLIEDTYAVVKNTDKIDGFDTKPLLSSALGTFAYEYPNVNADTTFEAHVNSLPIMGYKYTSGSALREGTGDDIGKIRSGDKITVTLRNKDTFTSATGDFKINEHYTVENVPDGLTMKIDKISPTTLEITFTGRATSIADVNNIAINFKPAAFQKYREGSYDGEEGKKKLAILSKKDIAIDFTTTKPTVIYAYGLGIDKFNEGIGNGVGKFGNKITATLIGNAFIEEVANDTDFSQNTHYTTENTPPGLTMKVTKKSSTTVEISFTGRATTSIADVKNATITWAAAAFEGNSLPVGFSKNDIFLDFDTLTPSIVGPIYSSGDALVEGTGANVGKTAATPTATFYCVGTAALKPGNILVKLRATTSVENHAAATAGDVAVGSCPPEANVGGIATANLNTTMQLTRLGDHSFKLEIVKPVANHANGKANYGIGILKSAFVGSTDHTSKIDAVNLDRIYMDFN